MVFCWKYVKRFKGRMNIVITMKDKDGRKMFSENSINVIEIHINFHYTVTYT
jgi:hypothetical protein